YWDTLERSMWHLVDIELDSDILILNNGDATSVLISLDAFTNANAMLAEIDGVRGKLFSKRLHNAVLRYITDHGSNRQRVDYILNERYNVSLHPPDYSELTKHTTGEFSERFTTFKNEEILTLITMLEEFPSGMIATPGLKYIIRRLDGTPHPLYPAAPAVAWTSAGYIEFMESAFTGDYQHLQRLILHEKAHFLWSHLFDDQLKEDWKILGEWYQGEDGKWFTLNETEFVSAYAHGENPNEDMAETISYYIVNPDKLRSVSPRKYEFIQNRVMHGDRYISKIREDLTFRVYNLYPDYVYPGKIIRVKNRVIGEPEENKKVIVEIELHHESHLDLSSGGYIRIFSPSGTNKYIENYLWPVNEAGDGVPQSHILRTEIGASKHLPSGYWQPHAIQVWDSNWTERFTAEKKFGWKMYIENPLEDIKPPKYVPNSVKLTSKEVESEEGDYILVTTTFLAPDDTGIDWFRVGMNDQDSETYSRIADGGLRYRDGSYDKETGLAKITLRFPHYMPRGLYQVNYINLSDFGYNAVDVYFTEGKLDEKPASIYINTKTPDTQPAQLDVNRINVVATPTNPENPNGETFVDITFYVRDDISGYEIGGVNIRDPLGNIHHRWHYPHDNRGMYVNYVTGKYRKYTKQILLPVGSHPGIWGITNIHVSDKAGNKKDYDFTEIVRFEVDEDVPAAPTRVQNALLPNYPNPFNPETWIPYQLANASEVSISIYAINGQLVRRLNLGYQQAGVYHAPNTAAYWDGRNDIGEAIVSGIYFYSLSAKGFSATRKMLILK
ncbi:MAG: T9SS type A sorting domain-containing protein, partial [Candidatus Poribacteria bacterium]|nr:T9SS type A sorting domain-containing protein [Candidatus Poribacteria bacterium]